MKVTGQFLTKSTPTASKKIPTGELSPTAKTALANIAQLAGLPDKQAFSSFAVIGGAPIADTALKLTSLPSRYHLAIGKPEGALNGVAVVAKEVDGQIIGYRIYLQR